MGWTVLWHFNNPAGKPIWSLEGVHVNFVAVIASDIYFGLEVPGWEESRVELLRCLSAGDITDTLNRP
jgi:hypothetical protein